MAARAFYVIIEAGRAKAYYSKWGALGCINSFAEGLEGARRVETGEQVGGLDNFHWVEGGYLIDLDEKKAIVFGHRAEVRESGESEGDSSSCGPDSPFVQGGLAYLQHVAPNWTGWKLAWDEHGVDAFSAHLRRRNISDLVFEPDMSGGPETPGPIEYQA